MLGSWQNFAALTLGELITIILPTTPIILYFTDWSIVKILRYFASNKLLILGLVVLSSFISNLDQKQILIFDQYTLAGATIGAGVGFLIMQAVLSEA